MKIDIMYLNFFIFQEFILISTISILYPECIPFLSLSLFLTPFSKNKKHDMYLCTYCLILEYTEGSFRTPTPDPHEIYILFKVQYLHTVSFRLKPLSIVNKLKSYLGNFPTTPSLFSFYSLGIQLDS